MMDEILSQEDDVYVKYAAQ